MKRYLLLDTGDFFVHFLDLASTELAKPGYKVDYVKLNALLQVCCVALYCVRETACVHACSACVYVLGAALTNILAFVCPQLPLSLSLSLPPFYTISSHNILPLFLLQSALHTSVAISDPNRESVVCFSERALLSQHLEDVDREGDRVTDAPRAASSVSKVRACVCVCVVAVVYTAAVCVRLTRARALSLSLSLSLSPSPPSHSSPGTRALCNEVPRPLAVLSHRLSTSVESLHHALPPPLHVQSRRAQALRDVASAP